MLLHRTPVRHLGAFSYRNITAILFWRLYGYWAAFQRLIFCL